MFLYSVIKDKLDTLGSIAKRRKGRLLDNAAYLQFMWKADVVESWIADKENHVRSEDLGRELSSVQTHAGKITISLLILSLAS